MWKSFKTKYYNFYSLLRHPGGNNKITNYYVREGCALCVLILTNKISKHIR